MLEYCLEKSSPDSCHFLAFSLLPKHSPVSKKVAQNGKILPNLAILILS
jgi:hypothetical protein